MGNREIALSLAAAGIAVFPCSASGEEVKKPLRGVYWRKQSTTDSRQIERWWEAHPDALPAIDLAKIGLLVVDCDAPNKPGAADGVAWFEARAASHGFEPETAPGCRTLSGGRHFYFRQPSGEPLGNARGSLPPKQECGIDIRGAGGYVIAAGASLPDGRSYEGRGNLLDALPLPDWLAALLRGDKAERLNEKTPPAAERPAPAPVSTRGSDARVAAYAEAGVEAELAKVRGAGRGERNIVLNNAALALGGMVASGWITEGDVWAWLEDAASACGLVKDDGIRSVRATIRSGLRAGMKQPRQIPPELQSGVDGAAVARALIAGPDGTLMDAETGEIVEPEPPAPIADDPFAAGWEEFRAERDPAITVGLVGELTTWICETSRRPNRPLALAAAVSIVGTVCSRHIVGPTSSSTHLFIACLGETSIGKARPMKAIGQVLAAAKLGALVKTGKFKSDTSIELMIEANPVSVAIVDEIGSNLFVKMTNRRATSHESTISAVLRELWSVAPGDIFSTSARAMAATKNLESPMLSIFGVSTIQEFYRSLSGATIDNGFLNRFTIVRAAPRSEEGEPVRDPLVVPDHITSRLISLLPPDAPGGLPGIQALIGHQAPAKILRIPFASEDVKQLYTRFANRILQWSDENTGMEPFVGRTAEMAIRLATIHALGDGGREATVDEFDFRWGAELALRSAGFMIADAAANMAENEYQANFKRVQETIRKAGRISRSDLIRKIDGRIDMRTLDGILAALEGGNQIVVDTKAPSRKGGQPKRTYISGKVLSEN